MPLNRRRRGENYPRNMNNGPLKLHTAKAKNEYGN